MTDQDDKVTADPLRAWINGGDRQALKLASDAQAAASLRGLMDQQEAAHPDLDSERLIRAARALQGAEKWLTPAVAIAWLKQRPDHTRLGVVLCLLLVSWTRAPETPPPEPALVEALLGVYDRLPHDVISENTLMIVLVHASHAGLPPPLAARVRSMLERARATSGREPEVRAILDAYLDTPAG